MSWRRCFGNKAKASARFELALRVISDAVDTPQSMKPQWPVVIGQSENKAGPTRLNSFTGPQ